MEAMQISVSVGGRLHSFDLARELESRGLLSRFLTTHPAFSLRKFGVDSAKVKTHPWIEVARRIWGRAPAPWQERWNGQFFFNHKFDEWAAARLDPNANVHIAWSGYSLETLRRAKELGILAVVDRGSSHILTQQKLLEEEYAKFGLPFRQTHPKVLEQEVAEYETADVIHAPSLFSLKSFRDRGIPESKLFHLPYGFSPSTFKSTAPKDKGFRIVFAGNLSLRKGLHYLLDAFEQLKLKDAQLWVFGSPSPEFAAAGIRLDRPGVKYFGKQPWPVLADHFSRGTVFCIPSVEDGFAIVLLQAMACGLPVLGTHNTGAPDAVRNGQEGFLFPIRDVDAMKESILWCYQNREKCDEMGQAAQKRALDHFQWKDYGDKIAAFYEAKLGSSVKRARG